MATKAPVPLPTFRRDQSCNNNEKFRLKNLVKKKQKSKIILPRQKVKIRTSNRHKLRMFIRKRKPFFTNKFGRVKTKVVDKVNSVTEKIQDKFTDVAFELQMMSFENPFSRDFYEDHCTIM